MANSLNNALEVSAVDAHCMVRERGRKGAMAHCDGRCDGASSDKVLKNKKKKREGYFGEAVKCFKLTFVDTAWPKNGIEDRTVPAGS